MEGGQVGGQPAVVRGHGSAGGGVTAGDSTARKRFVLRFTTIAQEEHRGLKHNVRDKHCQTLSHYTPDRYMVHYNISLT